MSGAEHKPTSVSKSPQLSPVKKDALHTKALANLGQSVWEATQWLTYDEVREYVESVLREVESDEP